jgi:ATP phosphoribosyltransferase
LEPLDHIADISSRLVVNKASMKTKHQRIQQFIEQVRLAVREREHV